MPAHPSALLLARRPVPNKLRQVIGYLNTTMAKYSFPTGAIRERMRSRLHKLMVPRSVLTRIHDFRLQWQRRGVPNGIGTPVRWAHIASLLHRVAPFNTANGIDVYDDTGEAFERMWESIDSAKVSIRWATYICKDDRIGRETIDRLVRAAKRGVYVQFIYDDGGNIGGRDELLAPLRDEPNAHVICFNPVFRKMLRYFLSFRWRLSPGIRNHRKILLADDSIAFVGGLNIGNEYAGRSCGGTGKFRDTMCRVTGPVVEQIVDAFRETMHSNERSMVQQPSLFTRQKQRMQQFIATPRKQFIRTFAEIQERRRLRKEWRNGLQRSEGKKGKLTQILTSNSWMGSYAIQKAYHIVLNRSRHRVWITTPYFIPTRRLLRAVLRAAKRGVDVRILTGSIRTTDPFLMWWGSQYIVHKLLKYKVKLYEYEGECQSSGVNLPDQSNRDNRVMHAKTLVVDGVWCSIGSYNLDVLSNKLLEISVASIDYGLASEIESQFLRDLKQSRQISQDAFNNRSVLQKFLIVVIYHIGRMIEKVFFWSFSHREVVTSLDESDS